MSKYTVLTTQKHTYRDDTLGIVDGVKVIFRIDDLNERGEVNLPVMNAAKAKLAIEAYIAEREALNG